MEAPPRPKMEAYPFKGYPTAHARRKPTRSPKQPRSADPSPQVPLPRVVVSGWWFLLGGLRRPPGRCPACGPPSGFPPGLSRKGGPPLRAGPPFLDLPGKPGQASPGGGWRPLAGQRRGVGGGPGTPTSTTRPPATTNYNDELHNGNLSTTNDNDEITQRQSLNDRTAGNSGGAGETGTAT